VRRREVKQPGFYGHCAHCGIEIKWEPVRMNGKVYCWQGCADGEPVPKLNPGIGKLLKTVRREAPGTMQ